MPIFGRFLEFTGPYADLRHSRLVFIRHIHGRIFPVGERVAVLDHPPPDIHAVHLAGGDHAAIAVCGGLRASDGVVAYQIRERERRFTSATVFLPIAGAEL